jgi:hypothetical protein
MRFCIGLFPLCLLATPLAAVETPFLRAGTLAIAGDPALDSFLPVSVDDLKDGLCLGVVGSVGEKPPITPRGECEISVQPPPRLGFFTDGAPSRGSSLQVSVQPASFATVQASAPVATSCGLWDVFLGIDPDQVQPVSALALETSAADSAQGVFAGEVKVAVRFHFANRDDGRSFDLAALLPVELAGHWAADGSGTDLGEGASNLVLFAGVYGGRWSAAPSSATWGIRHCPIQAVPPPDVLETLNPSVDP